MSELEPYADAILADFGVSQEAVCELVQGKAEPMGLLPINFPADMDTVEAHAEDVPFDYEVYVDSVGHAYQFAYGLNWSGVIEDERTRKYTLKK